MLELRTNKIKISHGHVGSRGDLCKNIYSASPRPGNSFSKNNFNRISQETCSINIDRELSPWGWWIKNKLTSFTAPFLANNRSLFVTFSSIISNDDPRRLRGQRMETIEIFLFKFIIQSTGQIKIKRFYLCPISSCKYIECCLSTCSLSFRISYSSFLGNMQFWFEKSFSRASNTTAREKKWRANRGRGVNTRP